MPQHNQYYPILRTNGNFYGSHESIKTLFFLAKQYFSTLQVGKQTAVNLIYMCYSIQKSSKFFKIVGKLMINLQSYPQHSSTSLASYFKIFMITWLHTRNINVLIFHYGLFSNPANEYWKEMSSLVPNNFGFWS